MHVGPLVQEFQLYERDVTALDPGPPAADLLEAGKAKRNEAKLLAEKGHPKEALPIAEKAIADARLALAAAQADAAERRAGDCQRAVERGHQEWENAIISLEQAERTGKRQASQIPRDPPALEETATPPLPAAGRAEEDPRAREVGELSAEWKVWSAAASDRRIPTADLEGAFASSMAMATDKRTREDDRPHHLYLAARLLQELEARVRAEAADQACIRSAALAERLADATAEALHATLGLEATLKDELRAEARDRQSELYDALHQIEGKFARITKAARGTIVSLADILFDFDKATLRRDTEFNLVKVATILNQFPEMNIQIEGHTDDVGTPEYNLDLSRRRAQGVYSFLVSQDVSPGRLTAEGYGESRPVADNGSDAGRQRNRRVDLVIR